PQFGRSRTSHRSGRGNHSIGRARNRSHAAALSFGRERIPDRRPVVPPEGHPRPPHGYRAGREGLRDHRARQDRDDPQLTSDRSAAADRRSGGRHKVQSAAARVSEIESDLGRVRIELVEAESRATSAREAAHARELSINRRQQQIAFDREQMQTLDARSAAVAGELETIELRREPARASVMSRREAAAEADKERDRAAAAYASESEAYEAAHREIEGLEADVEAARSEVFSAINSATALRHAVDHAAMAREKVAETLAKLDIESGDLRVESERVALERTAASDGLRRAHDAIEA